MLKYLFLWLLKALFDVLVRLQAEPLFLSHQMHLLHM
jgi:hypothetical protein